MNKLFLRVFYGFLTLLVGSAFAFKVFQPVQVLPRMQLSPAFALTNQNGKPFTSESTRGQFTLYTFTYTNCPDTCFDVNQTMKEVQSRLGEVQLNGIKVGFVTISIDPERDTPEVLKSYAQSINADLSNWQFATTTNKALLKTIIGSGFQTYYEDKGDGTFAFDPTFVLVDGWGIVRAAYRYQTEVSNTDRILRHLGVLASEVKNSVGATKLAYEAAHVFLCYAP
ncbi:MAG: SCO family protein [Anaerolineales bacterium]